MMSFIIKLCQKHETKNNTIRELSEGRSQDPRPCGESEKIPVDTNVKEDGLVKSQRKHLHQSGKRASLIGKEVRSTDGYN